ncbi:helicase-related protein [Kiloniella laminariae]|uniref:Helicase-related protein n=1 Tax=Kiloniella laminariae TaxID=454162 RepID=A0ABT4LKQ7_9PROT|nr:helicase-related protein [Kiloniella laminariae]MCZ4281688.1 helicase-related protein [Kiloniella laminariae]
MDKVIYEGPTGSGKTFQALKKAKSKGSFAYLAPCRQLVYETFMRYAQPGDTLSTGELKIKGRKSGNFFGVFESQPPKVDSIIIDECHFLTDPDRGPGLYQKINENPEINIFLCTGTRTFRKTELPGFSIEKIKPIRTFQKKEISFGEFLKRKDQGVPSIIFHKYSDNCGQYGGYPVTADTPIDQRLEAQIAFSRGEIPLIECTNVLAQGLNFPAQNILIIANQWDTTEILAQKIGRLGRPGFNNESDSLTYCIEVYAGKVKKTKKLQKEKFEEDISWKIEPLIENGHKEAYDYLCNNLPHEVPEFYVGDSGLFGVDWDKYSFDTLLTLEKNGILPPLDEADAHYFEQYKERTLNARKRAKRIIMREFLSNDRRRKTA